MRRLSVLHPFLFAIAPAIFLWNYNYSEVFVWEVFVTLSAILLFAGFVVGMLWVFYRDSGKTAVVASVLLTLTFFYQYIFFSALTFQFMRHRWALLLSAGIVAGVAYAVRRTKSDLAVLNTIVAVVAGTFVMFSLVQLAGNSYVNLTHDEPKKLEAVQTGTLQDPRNIYYIIVDEYTSADVLKNVLGSRDDLLADFLKKKGFYVPDSRSNYPSTFLSLPSSLNMRFVTEEYDNDSVAGRRTLTELTQDHVLKDFLRAAGYRYIHFGSPWVDHFNPYADENINIDVFSPYQEMVLNISAFAPITMTLTGHGPIGEKLVFLRFDALDFRLTHWKRIKLQLEELAKIPERNDGPVFVFAHLLIPHDPFVFNADGSFATKEEVDARSYKENYLAQVAYINGELEKLIVRLQESDPQPILILQGDHGHKFPMWDPELLKKEYDLEPEEAAELMTRILNAYYLPGGGNKLLYPTITPVNSFRIVLNHYFGQTFELLKDDVYMWDTRNSSQLNLLR